MVVLLRSSILFDGSARRAQEWRLHSLLLRLQLFSIIAAVSESRHGRQFTHLFD